MASIGSLGGHAAKAARAERFAAEAAAGAPEAPERRFAHKDFDRARIVRTDPDEKLLSLLKRKLATGEELTPVQLAALAKVGVPLDELRAEALADKAMSKKLVPEIYRMNGVVSIAPIKKVRPAKGASFVAKKAPSSSSSSSGEAGSGKAAKRMRTVSMASDGAAALNDAVPFSASSSITPGSATDASKRAKVLLKRLKRIDDALAEGGALNDSWQRRVASRPEIIAGLAALGVSAK